MGGYALGYWGKSYFSMVYPEYDDTYAIAYFMILIFGSVPSELMGGYIGDKYENVQVSVVEREYMNTTFGQIYKSSMLYPCVMTLDSK